MSQKLQENNSVVVDVVVERHQWMDYEEES